VFANPAWWQVKGGLQFLWDINISHLHLAVMLLLCTLKACVGIANVVACEGGVATSVGYKHLPLALSCNDFIMYLAGLCRHRQRGGK